MSRDLAVPAEESVAVGRRVKPALVPVGFYYHLRRTGDHSTLTSVSEAITKITDGRGIEIDGGAEVGMSQKVPGGWASLQYKVLVPRSMLISRNHHDDIVQEMHEAVSAALAQHGNRLSRWRSSTPDRGYGSYRRCF